MNIFQRVTCLFALLLGIGCFGADAQAESHYGQSIDLRLFSPPAGNIKGELRLNEVPFAMKEIQFFLVKKGGDAIVWKGTESIMEKKELSKGRIGIDFDIDVSSVPRSGAYYLYAGVFDTLNERIGVGKKLISFQSLSRIDKIENVSVRQQADKGVIQIDFAGQNAHKELRLVAEVFENNLQGSSYGSFQSDFVSAKKSVVINLSLGFPWPTVPESYVIVIHAEDKEGNRYGGEMVKRIVVEGEFAEILGVTPSVDGSLGIIETLSLKMRGYVPYGRFYDLQLEVEQKRDALILEDKVETVVINAETDSVFLVSEKFDIHPNAEWISLQASIINPETQKVLEKKNYTWKTGNTPIIETSSSEEITENDLSKKKMNFSARMYGLGTVLLILGILMYLFLRNRTALKALILIPALFGAQVFAADISAGYDTKYITLDEVHQYTTETSVEGFNQVPLYGKVARSGGSNGAFEEHVLDSVNVELKKEDDTYQLLSPISVEDVLIDDSDISYSGVFSEYRMFLNLEGLSIVDGLYGVRLEFEFNDGDSVFVEREDLFRIDTSYPVANIVPANTNVEKGEKDIIVSCTNNEPGPCIDQPEVGSGDLDGSQSFIAKVKGNFCTDTNDVNKVCKKDTSTAFHGDFEVCDGAGNCSTSNSATADLFYYDPFPPRMTEIELIRVETERYDSSTLTIVRNEDGSISQMNGDVTNDREEIEPDTLLTLQDRWSYDNDTIGGNNGSIAAHAQFAFDLVDDSDTSLGDLSGGSPLDVEIDGDVYTITTHDHAGPESDPNACGEQAWDGDPLTISYTDKTYGADNRKSDFFFGSSVDEPTISKCRQRKVSCSNGPGHRGFWDRSVNAGTAVTARKCTLDGVPIVGTPDCGEGFIYDSGSTSCVKEYACSPLDKATIQNDPNTWFYDGNPNTFIGESPVFVAGNDDGTGVTDSCRWGCAAGWEQDGSTLACVAVIPTYACDATDKATIQSDPNTWFYEGSPSSSAEESPTFVAGNDDGTGVTDACRWGCGAGWEQDGSNLSCVAVMTGSCSDGIQNQDEVAVDCGGVCDAFVDVDGDNVPDDIETFWGFDPANGADGFGATVNTGQTIIGTSSDEILYSRCGGDRLRGLLGNDTLLGESGEDRLEGDRGDDVLVGGEDSDKMEGSYGNDVYLWEKGGHRDFIIDGNGDGSDINIIRFGSGISSADVELQRGDLSWNTTNPTLTTWAPAVDGSELMFWYKDPSESPSTPGLPSDNVQGEQSGWLVVNFWISRDNRNSFTIEFVDEPGTVWEGRFLGTPGEDNLQGSSGDDVINGVGANDNLDGLDGNDTLVGGLGDDEISGGDGNDTLLGEFGEDELEGGYGNDTLIGGEGSDRVWGAQGNDVFLWEKGDHRDLIIDGDGSGSDVNVIRFGSGISSADVELQRGDISWNPSNPSLSTWTPAVGGSELMFWYKDPSESPSTPGLPSDNASGEKSGWVVGNYWTSSSNRGSFTIEFVDEPGTIWYGASIPW